MQLGLPVDSQQEKKGGLVFSFLENDAQAPVARSHRPRRRAHHPQHRRSRQPRPREAPRAARRDVSHAARPLSSRDRALLLGRSHPRHARADAVPRSLRGSEQGLQHRAPAPLPAGPPPDWQSAFVSTYATMHPWEDWAETWAHYLHIVDTLGTARATAWRCARSPSGCADGPARPHLHGQAARFRRLRRPHQRVVPADLRAQQPQSRNGPARPLPVRPVERAIDKLRFVHDVIERARVVHVTALAGRAAADTLTRLGRPDARACIAVTALVAAFAAYLVGMNVFLRTRLFRDAITSSSGSLLVEYHSAYSLWPGRIHVEGLTIRGRDSSVEWIIRLDRCDFRVSFAALARRRFHASHVNGDGLSLRSGSARTAPCAGRDAGPAAGSGLSRPAAGGRRAPSAAADRRELQPVVGPARRRRRRPCARALDRHGSLRR